MAGELRRQGFEVELLTDVTGAQLREALRRFFAFKGKDPQARLFVWFAGHGHTENGEGYLVPADAPLPGSAEFNYVALHMGNVGSMVRIARSKHVLVVFDSCFAGTIFNSQRARPPRAITAAVKRPVRQFLTSGDVDQKVSDDGTFRTLFLRALRGEETADANRDGYLTGTELSFYLEDRMINLTEGAQTPRGGKLRDPKFDQGDFVFVVATPGETGADRPAVTSEQDSLFWTSIKDGDEPAAFQAYLQRFPDGTFAPLARLKMRQLVETATASAMPSPDAPSKPEPKAKEPAVAALTVDRFDGKWKWRVSGLQGLCSGASLKSLEIHNGLIRGTGYHPRAQTFSISGKVDQAGNASMAAYVGETSVTLTGRFDESSGKGQMIVVGEADCRGKW